MRMTGLVPMLQSSDLGRTEKWYAETLGFRRVGRDAGWLRLERDDVALMFMHNQHFGTPAATATQYIYVDDVDGLWQNLKNRVSAEWGPEDFSYGNREFAIKDPDGYLLSFGQKIVAQAAEMAEA